MFAFHEELDRLVIDKDIVDHGSKEEVLCLSELAVCLADKFLVEGSCFFQSLNSELGEKLIAVCACVFDRSRSHYEVLDVRELDDAR